MRPTLPAARNWPRRSSCCPMASTSPGRAWCWCCRSSAAAVMRRCCCGMRWRTWRRRGAPRCSTRHRPAMPCTCRKALPTPGASPATGAKPACRCRARRPGRRRARWSKPTGRRSMRWTGWLSVPAGCRCCAVWRSACRRRHACWSRAGGCAATCSGAMAAKRCRSARCWPMRRTWRSGCCTTRCSRWPAKRSTWIRSTSQAAALTWLQQQGFVFQRPFTRMVHGTDAAPGDPATIVLAAGPELG